MCNMRDIIIQFLENSGLNTYAGVYCEYEIDDLFGGVVYMFSGQSVARVYNDHIKELYSNRKIYLSDPDFFNILEGLILAHVGRNYGFVGFV